MTERSVAEFHREWRALPDHWFSQRPSVRLPQPKEDPVQEAIHRLNQNVQVSGQSDNEVLAKRVSDARKAQKVAIAVAIGVNLVVLRDGVPRTLREGEEVLPTDLIGNPQRPVASVVALLEGEDAVIALSPQELERVRTPASARFVVAEDSAITSKRGIVGEGCAVTADDFHCGQADVDRLVALGVVIDRGERAEGKAA